MYCCPWLCPAQRSYSPAKRQADLFVNSFILPTVSGQSNSLLRCDKEPFCKWNCLIKQYSYIVLFE